MKRILVVDDIAENRYLLEAMLQAYGYEVTSANDGAEALAAARHQPPDLVISDILMPVMDGFTLCKHWRAEAALRGIPFIFYTATYTDARDEQLAMDLGADRFVLKPQEPQVMHAIIQDVLSLAAKLSNVAEATTRPADETVTLREYNEVLVRKLEKKVAELEATRVTSDAELRQRHHIEEALRRSDERWRLIYETEPECVKVVSADGRLLSMNPAGLAMIDALSLDDVCGRRVVELVVPEHREAFLAMHRDVLAGQTRHLVFEVIGLNGRRRWLETHEAPLTNEDGTVSLLGITRDITELKQSEALVNGQKQVLELIASRTPLNESLTALLRVVESQTTDMLCSILLLDADEMHLRHGAAPSLPSEYCRAIDGVTIGSCVGSCGTAAFRREPVFVTDIATDPLWADFRELALSHGLRACWSTPIFDATRRLLGTFAMYYGHPAQPNEQQLRLIDMATHTAAIAISKHHEEVMLHAAQAALRESEERLSLAVAAADLGIFEHCHITDTVYWSPTLRRIFGWDDDEPASLPAYLGLVHPDDRTAITAAVQQALDPRGNGQFMVEHRIALRDGGIRWVQLLSHTAFEGLGNERHPVRTIGTVADTSQRKNAEAALRSSEERFSKLFRNSPDAIAVVGLPDGRLIDVNDQFVKLTGYGRDEAISRTTLELGLWENSAERERFYQLVRQSVSVRVFEGIMRTKSGELRDVQFSADTIELDGRTCAITTGRDVTAQKRAEEALRESQARLRLSVQAANIGLWDWNLLTNENYFSSEWSLMLGYADLEIPHRYEEWEKRLHPEDRARTLSAVSDVLAGRRANYDVEFRLRHKDGSWRSILARADLFRDSAGNPVNMMGCHVDITERNRANEELKSNRERLEVLSRQLIAAQETERRHLARELHDEIGQALTAIKLNLKALQQPVPAARSGPLLQETIGVVDQTLQQVRSLALDLRPSMLDDIGLVAALRWCLDRQSQRAGFTPQFVADSSVRGASPTINTACFRIVQECLTNIARHAKASNVRVELRQNDSDLELFVADDGIGFDFLAARHRASSGESIGLLGMEERVQLVGGQIEIVSNPSGGTTIHARIPLTGNSS